MSEDRPHPPKASELLGDWRVAERDVVAARTAQEVAARALDAAKVAEEAAAESQKAAQAAVVAAERAQQAADLARQVATEVAEAAATEAAGEERSKSKTNHVLEEAESAESAARDRYHEAEAKGFPKS